MTAPVFGPFSRYKNYPGVGYNGHLREDGGVLYKIWYRQRKPYDLPLSYIYARAQITSWSGEGSTFTYITCEDDGETWPSVNPSVNGQNAYNKAYDKFKNKVQAVSAGLAVTLAQRQQAVSMIEKRGTQLLKFVQQLRRGHFLDAARTLGIEKPKSLKAGSKSLADNFLEYRFGWKPLIDDIHSSIEILQDGCPPVKVQARSSENWTVNYHTSESSDPINYFKGKRETAWKIGATIIVENPNLHLADQVGALNPALVAWDVIPYSFVVGWFVNVEQYLSSYTDFVGLTLSKSYITNAYSATTNRYQIQKNWPHLGANTLYYDASISRVQVQRVAGGIPGPSLELKPFRGFSITRGLTAIALLVQHL